MCLYFLFCNIIISSSSFHLLMDFLCSSVGKESACNAGDPGEGKGNPLQYSCLENPMDRGDWQAIVHGFARVEHDLVTKPPNQPPNIRVKISLWTSVSYLWATYLEGKWLDHMVILFSTFWETFILFFIVVEPNHIPTNNYIIPISLHPYQHLLSLVFLMIAILTGVI